MKCALRLRCPHCESKAIIRESREIDALTYEHLVQCPDVYCAHTWVAQTTTVRTIRPSKCPDPGVSLQFSQRMPPVDT